MKVEEILKAKGDRVETIAPEASIRAAVHKLATLHIGALVVSSDGEHVEGLLSDRDVVRRLDGYGPDFADLRVAQVMTTGVRTCAPQDTVTEVMAIMTRTRNRHIPVVAAERLCGLVSIGDVVKSRLDEMELEARVLRDAYLGSR